VSAAPAANEIEVSVFGPGYGECVVLHLGENNWFIVDSCIDPETKDPVALTYLRQMGVDPSEAVKQVIATHWHDDHLRGLGDIVAECKSAQFVCSAALRSGEFFTLVDLFGTGSMMESSGIEEFYRVLEYLQNRSRASRAPSIPLKLANADKRLWRSDINHQGMTVPCAIHSLSPSDNSFVLSQIELARLIPEVKLPKRRLLPESPNHLSVVLWVQVGNVFILLGADLQETGDPATGWSAIVGGSTLKDEWVNAPEKASFFKIPHHGSENGNPPEVWEEMLTCMRYESSKVMRWYCSPASRRAFYFSPQSMTLF
jgi:hypothetical protein